MYQGRFKSFPVQEDEHLLSLCRYVERNALRAGLASLAQAWRWSSLWQRQRDETQRTLRLSPGPVAWPEHWLKHVNQAQTEAEVEAVRRSIARGQPLGTETWSKRTATRLGLGSTLRPRGRPKKTEKKTEKGSWEQDTVVHDMVQDQRGRCDAALVQTT